MIIVLMKVVEYENRYYVHDDIANDDFVYISGLT